MIPANVVEPRRGHPADPAGGLRALGVSWESLGEQKIGFGAVVWLRLAPAAIELATMAPAGAEPLARPAESGAEDPASGSVPRALRIGETGQVPEIEVENRCEGRLLLPAHTVVSGGWQTRAVERSVVVPPHGVARVPVKCVEAGRWAPRDDKTGTSFKVSERTGLRTRWSVMRSMAAELARTGRFMAEQSAIWQHVDEELARSPVASQTRSYEAYLVGVKQRWIDAARAASVRAPAQANGVLLLPRGGGFWLEAYATTGALGEQLDDLLADLFDPAAKGDVPPHDAASVEALLDALWSAPLRPIEVVPGTVGDAYALTSSPGVANLAPSASEPAGAALMLDRGVAHLGLGAPPRRAAQPAVREAFDLASQMSAERAAEVYGVEGPVSYSRPMVGLDAMRSIFSRARDLVPDVVPPRERVQGYRLVRVFERNISWVDIHIGGDGYAVLGSHDRCDLVLASDSGIWLRHLVATCARLDDGTVGLRLIDLKTNVPFFLEDDNPQWSVTANGPFAMRLGRHVVCGFPIGPSPTGELPLGEPAAAAEPPAAHPAAATGRFDTRSLEGSLATAAPARSLGGMPVVARTPLGSTSFLASAPVSQIHDLLGPSASANHVRVTLERGGMGASVELPTEALDAGVLLGRALNCFDGGLRRIFCEAISRAHVLLLRDRDGVYALDLCSTNGTRVGGHRIRRHKLSDDGSTLELGKKVIFRWHRRVRPEPANGV